MKSITKSDLKTPTATVKLSNPSARRSLPGIPAMTRRQKCENASRRQHKRKMHALRRSPRAARRAGAPAEVVDELEALEHLEHADELDGLDGGEGGAAGVAVQEELEGEAAHKVGGEPGCEVVPRDLAQVRDHDALADVGGQEAEDDVEEEDGVDEVGHGLEGGV